MLELLQKGGILMYPIVALSVLSLAIFMERLFMLRKERYAPANFTQKLTELLRDEKYTDAANLCELQHSALSRIAQAAIGSRELAWDELYAVAENAGRREANKLGRFQETMSMITTTAPLLGLLGTIFGMIKIFNVLSAGGAGNATALSGGIAEALLTTAAGLTVAIPAQIFYYIIKHRSDLIVKELEGQTVDIVTLLSSGRSR
ncbi:MAG: MotA/TolQ/ExbB proton channel family protein [Deferribacteraceae bacterium]|jgi:biopolymer transport protein ExbB|nr:MotA/TolQ/ExbB proton channel family protein [Deferribacteraceae bacterium]